PPGMATWIADLASEDGAKRVAATREIFRLGNRALDALQRAGARPITSEPSTAPRRLDIVYTLLNGLPPIKHHTGHKDSTFGVYLVNGWQHAELARVGRQLGFTPMPTPQYAGKPHSVVMIDRDRNLAEVMKAVLTTDPSVVTVTLLFLR